MPHSTECGIVLRPISASVADSYLVTAKSKGTPPGIAGRESARLFRVLVGAPPIVEYLVLSVCVLRTDIGGSDRDFAKPVGDIENVTGQAQTRKATSQAPHECLAGLDGDAEVGRAWCKVRMMQVVGSNLEFDQSAKQGLENLCVVVNTVEQHSVTQEYDAAVD